jgi:hypothetical protein
MIVLEIDRAAVGMVGALVFVLISSSSCSKDAANEIIDADALRLELARIPTAAGGSVLDRMAACQLRIDWSESTLTIMPTAAKDIDLDAGDRILNIRFSAPTPPGEPTPRVDANARWRIRADEITPRNDWATSIQQTRRPIGSSYYLDC